MAAAAAAMVGAIILFFGDGATCYGVLCVVVWYYCGCIIFVCGVVVDTYLIIPFSPF